MVHLFNRSAKKGDYNYAPADQPVAGMIEKPRAKARV